jgi:hypothetical protein
MEPLVDKTGLGPPDYKVFALQNAGYGRGIMNQTPTDLQPGSGRRSTPNGLALALPLK